MKTSHLIGLGVTALIAVVIGVLALVLPGGDSVRAAGARLAIAVVAPPERAVDAGEIMEVGALTDGYVHQPIASQPPEPDPFEVVDAWLPGEAPVDPAARVRTVSREANIYESPAPADLGWRPDERRVSTPHEKPRAENPMAFGFDAPRPDYRAEREARRARLDAVAAVQQTGADAAAHAAETFY